MIPASVRLQQSHIVEPPVQPPTFVARPKPAQPEQAALTAAQTLHRSQMEQMLPSQSSVGSDYRWATLNVDAIIGGHTFPAGTRIVVAPSQTSTSGGGKAHTSSIVTKVWVKFGQTFDSSSWVEGAISANLFTYTGQTATWNSSNGFGAPDSSRMPSSPAVRAAAASRAYSAPQQSFPVDYGSQSAVPPNPMSGAYGDRPFTAHQAFIDAQRSTAANAMNAGDHIYGRPDPEPPNYPRPPSGSKKHGTGIPHGGGHGGHGGGGGGHHGGGGHGGGSHFRSRFGARRFGGWGWGPELIVVQNDVPYCVWREIGALPAYVFAAFATAARTTFADGTSWRQAFSGGRWWAEHTGPSGPAVFYECDFSGSGFAGLPDPSQEEREKAMTMQNGVGALASRLQPQQPQGVGNLPRAVGVGAVAYGTPRGLSRATGVGMPGPDFGKDSDLSAGTYEITGTEVALFSDNASPPPRGTLINPSTPGVIKFFNTAYGDNGGKIAGAPDQVDVATTEMRNGRRYALVSVKSATNAGKTDPSHPDATNVSPGDTGLVATDYIAPVGWTASHGGTGPIPQPNQPQPEPPPNGDVTGTTAKKSSAIPWIIGGVVLTGLVVGGVVMGKKHHARRGTHHSGSHHHAPARAHEARRRGRRRR